MITEFSVALLDGVIDFIATDHAPHTLEEKAQGPQYAPQVPWGGTSAAPDAHRLSRDAAQLLRYLIGCQEAV